MFGRIHLGNHQNLDFVWGEFLIYRFNFITYNWSAQIFYFFMTQSWKVYVSKNLSISSLFFNLLAYHCSSLLWSILCISVMLRKYFLSKKMKLHLLNIGKYILVGKQLHNKLTNNTIIITLTHMWKNAWQNY